jgi:hypothetical protein
MEQNGFDVKTEHVPSLALVRIEYPIPPELQSCHTAIVDGYIIEGHVPIADIRRLLAERPEILGLAVAGMPTGSPGMETDSYDSETFDVIAFDKFGNTEVFSSYLR